LALVGLEGSEMAKVSLPVEDRSQIQVYSTTAGEYSLEELLAGDFKANPAKALELSRRLSEKDQDDEFVLEAARQLNEANFTDQSSFSYSYHSDDAFDDVDLSTKTADQPSTILALPNNQTVILVGVNATEIAKTPESYFLTQAEITNSPSVAPTQPSNNPSGPPSFLPSGPPSELPSGSPSEIPSTAPSELPSGPPSFLPSSAPSYLPNPQPSNNPVENPTNGPIEAPSSMPIPNPAPQPSVENSFEPTSQLPLSQPTPYFTAENSFVPSFPPSPPMDHYSSDFPSLAPSSLENTNNNSPELPNAAILGGAAGAAVFVCTAANYIRKRLNAKNKVHATKSNEEKSYDLEMTDNARGGR
jgi:hypothetical protein